MVLPVCTARLVSGQGFDAEFFPHAYADDLGRRGHVRGYLDEIRASDKRGELIWMYLGVMRDAFCNAASGDLDREFIREVGRAKVRYEVSEAIDADDLTLDARVGTLWVEAFEPNVRVDSGPEFVRPKAERKVGRRRSENVAAMEGRARLLSNELLVGDLENAGGFVNEYEAKQPIVRGRKIAAGGFSDYRSTARPDAGIDDAKKDRSRRKITDTGGKKKRGRPDIVRLDLMRDIDDRRVLIDS